MRNNDLNVRARNVDHTPFLAIWFQTRAALADLIIPVLAGIKTIWLLTVAPVTYFRAFQQGRYEVQKLRSPVDLFWRTLTREERPPLEPAHFLLFGILAAALAGFEFDSSNRLINIVQQAGIGQSLVENLSRQSPALGDAIAGVQQFMESGPVQLVRSLLDLTLISAISELIVTLFYLMIFAYLFRLLVGHNVSATVSYAIWLYMTGLQFLTTAASAILLSIISLPALGLPELTPAVLIGLLDIALFILWQLAFPTLIFPRLFAPLSRRRVFLSAALVRGVFAVASWALTVGFFATLTLWQSLLA